MARYVASVETHWEREAAFGYLAAFRRLGDNARDGLRRKLAEASR